MLCTVEFRFSYDFVAGEIKILQHLVDVELGHQKINKKAVAFHSLLVHIGCHIQSPKNGLNLMFNLKKSTEDSSSRIHGNVSSPW